MGGEDLRKTAEYQAQRDFFGDHARRINYSFSVAQLALGSELRLRERAKYIRENPRASVYYKEQVFFCSDKDRDDMLSMLDRSAAICALITEDLERDF